MLPLLLFFGTVLAAQPPAPGDASVMRAFAATTDFELTANPNAPFWRGVPGVRFSTDRYGKPVANAQTEVRSRWTAKNLYFLFSGQYESMRLRDEVSRTTETHGIWEYDVVEVFIGHDLENIAFYKEFEVTPQEEWVDLDVDRRGETQAVDWKWNSGFRSRTWIDYEKKIWHCEMQIPWASIDPRTPKAGNQLRLNLYRIEGSLPSRKFLAWQAVNAPSFHTPKAFGRLLLH